MKQKMLSLCLAFAMLLAAVTGVFPTATVQAAERLEPYTFEVEGELGASGNGAWAVSEGKEKDMDGKDVGYMQVSSEQYANGRWLVDFQYAGTYQMQMVMAVPTLTNQVHFEWAPEGGSFIVVDGNIPVEQTQSNEYRIFDGPQFTVEEAGIYDLKFGSWTAGADWKLDKFIFTCENPVQPPSGDEPLIVEKGNTLQLKESLAVNANGSLRRNPIKGSYVDYVIEVKEEGDYVLTYSIGANEAAVEDAFLVQVAEYKEEVGQEDFVQKLAPVQMTRYYDPILERQAIHLKAGKFVLRTRALNSGFSLTQFTISEQVVTQLSEDGTTVTIDAVDFNNGDLYHAIQNISASNKGNIGYAALGLNLDYAVQVKKGGIYTIVYHYTAAGDYSLTTQRVAGDQVIDLETSQLAAAAGGGNWYEADYIDSEGVPVLLAAGMNTLRVHWDAADINLKSIKLAYQGSAVEYVRDLLTALPEKADQTVAHEKQVNKAKASYDALTETEKSEISGALVKKLQDAITQVPILNLAKAVEDNQEELEKTFRTYLEEDYKPEKWTQLIQAKNDGLQAIGRATTIAEADRELRLAKAAMAAVQKKLKSIPLTADRTTLLAQSKAYRRNGFLNSQVKVGNYADYFVNVEEAGEYIFTYALYAEEAVEDAFAVKYDEAEYPDSLAGEYARVSVPKVEAEGNQVKEIRRTVALKAGEQTIRFEALNENVRLNRIKIHRKKAAQITAPKAGEAIVFSADSFTEAANPYILANGIVTETAAGTSLDYPVSVNGEAVCAIAYTYAYTKAQTPKLVLSQVRADGTVNVLAETVVEKTEGFTESAQTEAVLPAGDYTLRVTMEQDGVDLKDFIIYGGIQHIPADSIRLNAYRIRLQPKGSFHLTAELLPENATSEVIWSTENASVATVSADGTVTAVAEGSTAVTASIDGKTAQCIVTVGPEIPVQDTPNNPSVSELTPTFVTGLDAVMESDILYVGGNAQKKTAIDITVPTGANLASVTYVSAQPSVADVSAAGVVTAKKSGTAVITIHLALTNGETASLQRQIRVKKAYIKPKKAKYSVKTGKSITLKATVYGSDKKITYTFADKKSKKFASLTKAGKLTGKAKGTVKITAKSGKVKKTFQVKVK